METSSNLLKTVTYEEYFKKYKGNPIFHDGKYYDGLGNLLTEVCRNRRTDKTIEYPEYVLGTDKKEIALNAEEILENATKNVYGIDFANEAKWQLNELIDEWNNKYKIVYYEENNIKITLPINSIKKYIDIENKMKTLKECFTMKNFKEVLILMPEIITVPEHIKNRKFQSIRIGNYSLLVQANDFSFCTPTETLDNLDEYENMEIVLFDEFGRWIDITKDEFIRNFPRYDELENIIRQSIYPILAYVPVDLIQSLYEYLHTQEVTSWVK